MAGSTATSRAVASPSDHRARRVLEVPLDDGRWSEFVGASENAVAFHLPAWSAVLSRCYGYRSFAVAVPGPGGAIAAGMPLMEVKTPVGATRWVSLPFTDRCPPLGLERVPEAVLALAALEAAHAAGAARVVVHAPLGAAIGHAAVEGVTHTLELDPDASALRRRFARSQVQRNIARAEREDVVVRTAASEADVADLYYRLHVRTRRRQGVPVQPRRFFRLLWQLLIEPGHGFVLLAYAGSTPVAGAVFLAWNGTVTYKYGASEPAFWSLRPNHLLFWEAIRWSCENGYRTFDFGKTDLENRGLREFKNGWGTQEEPLVYSVLGPEPPRPSGSRAKQVAAAVIRRSPPLVCRAIGAALYRYAA